MVLPPPPPPRLPPPPPPLPGNASFPPPPPVDPETLFAVKDSLLKGCKLLEKGRCTASEAEANLVFSSSLLRQPLGAPQVDISSLPGGVQDAWKLLAEATTSPSSKTAVPTVQELMKREEMVLPVGPGQLGKAARMASLKLCIDKTASLRRQLEQEKPQHGTDLKKCIQTSKQHASFVASPDAQSAVWLQIFDERRSEMKRYHARHSSAVASAAKRPRLGNPSSDGYDLAGSLGECLQGFREGAAVDSSGVTASSSTTLFSEPEVFGKYLDFRSLYAQHGLPIQALLLKAMANIASVAVDNKSSTSKPKRKRADDDVLSYVKFLTILAKPNPFVKIDESAKLQDRKKYIRFLHALHVYLESFLTKTQPFLSLQNMVIRPAVKEFESEWREKGGSEGWQPKEAERLMVAASSATEMDQLGGKENGTSTVGNPKTEGIDLSGFATAKALEEASDGDRLKAELARLGMKCGGTLTQRAERLYLTKNTPLDQLPQKLFAKKKKASSAETNGGAVAVGTAKDSASVSLKHESRVDVARREVVVLALLNQLKPILEATIKRSERQETQTVKERQKEVDEDLHGSTVQGSKKKQDGDDGADESDDEDAPVYNPKGVPLGWDGKPIPYWLFKLHGLQHFYPCEICGNESYRGRKNFEMHFAESKHSFGMKSLGIPNTKHFHGVTKIQDAQKLWSTLKDQLQQQQFDGSREEEYEDSHGNVLSRATYEDLARQGLL